MSFKFSNRSHGGKDPLSAAGDGFRGSPIPNFLDRLPACQKGFLTRCAPFPARWNGVLLDSGQKTEYNSATQNHEGFPTKDRDLR